MITPGKVLLLFGWLLLMTPMIIGIKGPGDIFENLLTRFPLNKFMLLRAFTISGILFIMTGCVITTVGG